MSPQGSLAPANDPAVVGMQSSQHVVSFDPAAMQALYKGNVNTKSSLNSSGGNGMMGVGTIIPRETDNRLKPITEERQSMMRLSDFVIPSTVPTRNPTVISNYSSGEQDTLMPGQASTTHPLAMALNTRTLPDNMSANQGVVSLTGSPLDSAQDQPMR